eukprot:6203777-Pleurochrysis_carterae.AAC.1
MRAQRREAEYVISVEVLEVSTKRAAIPLVLVNVHWCMRAAQRCTRDPSTSKMPTKLKLTFCAYSWTRLFSTPSGMGVKV